MNESENQDLILTVELKISSWHLVDRQTDERGDSADGDDPGLSKVKG